MSAQPEPSAQALKIMRHMRCHGALRMTVSESDDLVDQQARAIDAHTKAAVEAAETELEALAGIIEDQHERLERARTDVCGWCNGHSIQHHKQAVGPNKAGNWVHPVVTSNSPTEGLLCAASGMHLREHRLAAIRNRAGGEAKPELKHDIWNGDETVEWEDSSE